MKQKDALQSELLGIGDKSGLILLLSERNSMLKDALKLLEGREEKIIKDELERTEKISKLAFKVLTEHHKDDNWEKLYKDLQAEVDKNLDGLSNFKESLEEKPQAKSLLERFSSFWKACIKLIASAFTSPKIDLSELEKQNESLKPALEKYAEYHRQYIVIDLTSPDSANLSSPTSLGDITQALKDQNLVQSNSQATPHDKLPKTTKKVTFSGRH